MNAGASGPDPAELGLLAGETHDVIDRLRVEGLALGLEQPGQTVGAHRQVPFERAQLVAGANDHVFAGREGGGLAERTVNGWIVALAGRGTRGPFSAR